MNKVKNKVRKDFTIIPNALINDNSLTDRARFLFVYMASKPEDWDFYQVPLSKNLGYSVDTLRKYISELIESGWMGRELRREGGKFDSYDYTLLPSPCGKNTDTVKNHDGKKPAREKSALYNKDYYKERLITKKDCEDAPANFQNQSTEQPTPTPPPNSAPPPSPQQVGAKNAPSIEQMIEYLEDLFLESKWQPRFIQNPPETAEEIYDYYTSNGWKVGRNPMKDWRAACRNWLKNNNTYGRPRSTGSSEERKTVKPGLTKRMEEQAKRLGVTVYT